MERLYNNIKDEQRNESQGGKKNKNMQTRCVSFCKRQKAHDEDRSNWAVARNSVNWEGER
jgi:hypothetical protein